LSYRALFHAGLLYFIGIAVRRRVMTEFIQVKLKFVGIAVRRRVMPDLERGIRRDGVFVVT